MDTELIAIVVLIPGLFGLAIGTTTGRPLVGTILGLTFGTLGWALTLLTRFDRRHEMEVKHGSRENTKGTRTPGNCPECDKPLDDSLEHGPCFICKAEFHTRCMKEYKLKDESGRDWRPICPDCRDAILEPLEMAPHRQILSGIGGMIYAFAGFVSLSGAMSVSIIGTCGLVGAGILYGIGTAPQGYNDIDTVPARLIVIFCIIANLVLFLMCMEIARRGLFRAIPTRKRLRRK